MTRSKIKTASITDDAVTGAKIENSPTIATNLSVTGDLTVDTNILKVDAANNRVGIGTASPATANLEIFTGSTAADGLKINRFASGVYYSTLRMDSHGLAFHVGDGSSIAERAAILSGGGLDLSAGHLVLDNGYGINFGATADTSGTSAEILDDYEEGTWTPALYKGGSELAVGSRYGQYTRVGRVLQISFYWYNNSITTSGGSNYTLQGMPYSLPHASNSSWQFIPAGYMNLGSNEVHRWQVNATDTLTLYGNSATDNASGTIEFSGAGVFFTS